MNEVEYSEAEDRCSCTAVECTSNLSGKPK